MKIFNLDYNYFKDIKTYTKKDAYIALLFYVFVYLAHMIIGYISKIFDLKLGIFLNIILFISVIIIVKKQKQKLSSIGITKRNFFKGIILGAIFGLLISIANNKGVIGLFNNNGNISLVIYYFFIIGLVEEIIFRGFIQTRMYGLIKNEIFCSAFVGLLFMILHIPYQLITSHVALVLFINYNYYKIFMTFLLHFAFNHLYMKYNSVVAPTVFHGFLNLSYELFVVLK